MNRWLAARLRDWADQPFVITSPLSVEAVSRRLAEDLAVEDKLFRPSSELISLFRIRGRIDEFAEVKLQAVRLGVRNSWRPVLRGRLVSSDNGNGCTLVARLGMPDSIRVFSLLWFGAFVVLLLFSTAAALYQVVAGDLNAAGSAAIVALVASGFVAFFVGLTTVASRMSRTEVNYLRRWLQSRLESDGGS